MQLLLFFVLFTFCNAVQIARMNISYEFLATRTVIGGPRVMNASFGPTIQNNYTEYCSSIRCFFPMYYTESGVFAYILMTDEQTNCTTYPNCISSWFNETTYYNYTIIFGSPNDTAETLLQSNFTVPKCNSTFSFQRANGRYWCSEVSTTTANHSQAEQACLDDNKYLNGFQSVEEQSYFTLTLNLMTNATIHLGATRVGNCTDSENCANMTWSSNIVSTNQALANNLNTTGFLNASGNNLVLLYNTFWGYANVLDNETYLYSCGWYAQ